MFCTGSNGKPYPLERHTREANGELVTTREYNLRMRGDSKCVN